jgi:hypothetical protein
MAWPLVNRTIARIATRLEPRLRAAFQKAVAQLQASIPLAAIELALERNDVTPEILAALADFPARLQPIGQVIARCYEQAGMSAAGHLASSLDVAISFDLVNPHAVTWAATEAGTLIREVQQTTVNGIREIISRAFTDGIPPRQARTLIRPLVGLTDRQGNAVFTYYQRMSQTWAPDAAEGLAQRYAAKLQKQRALLIARTETVKAAGAGQQEAWRQAVEQGLLDPQAMEQIWIVSRLENMCDLCKSAPPKGLNHARAPLGEPFVCDYGSFLGIPAHPACQCQLGLVRRDD